jgi:primosomal protein N' (replication factor Y) (superfamily II helicase)
MLRVPVSAPMLASIAVARPVRGEYTYRVPEELASSLRAGQRVMVPFGAGKALGFYLGPAESPKDPKVRLKSIARVLDEEPAVPEEVLALLRFAARHYRYPLGEAIKGALPPGLTGAQQARQARPEVVRTVSAAPGADPAGLQRAPAQAAVLSYLLAVGGRANLEELAHAVPGAKESVKKLLARGLVELREAVVEPGVRAGLAEDRPVALTVAQGEAVAAVVEAIAEGGFRPFLLHGVTGSGKTEVYLRAMERVLAAGRGGLILVPEIALTPQLVGRVRSRFGSKVAVLHSGLKDRERLLHWQALRRGEIQVAVGVRSAVFAPVRDLGLLVVDEEHDPSFKQDEKLRYNARDLAVVRARQQGATLVLGSATPSLETLENARRGRYRLLELGARVDDRPMPEVSVVDLREARPRDFANPAEPPVLSPPLLAAMAEVLDRGQQVILFLNRRGHSTFLLCEVCGASLRCTDCDVSLTHHLFGRKVVCHYCGRAGPVPERCADCGGGLLRLGYGTERVEAEVAERFPKARVARLDRDAASTAERLTELLAAFARRELDVLVGTQMVAKGHDFPGVTLVCVVMADTSLALPDFRAAERTFHLLTQVGGRAGRGHHPGRVLLQTYNPECETIRRVLAHDFDGFAEAELRRRKALAYPPFSRLAVLRIDGEDPDLTAQVAKTLGEQLERRMPPASSGVRLLGPAPAPIARIKGRSRWQLLLKGPTHASLAPLLGLAEAQLGELPHSVRVVIDVDPSAML